MKLMPEYHNKKREEECLKLKQTVFKLKVLLRQHETKNAQEKSAGGTSTPGQLCSELIMSN